MHDGNLNINMDQNALMDKQLHVNSNINMNQNA